VLVALLGVGTLLPLLVGGPLGGGMVMMSVALLGYGLAIAPFFACNSVLLGAAAPVGTVTEAFAWNSSMIFGGAALGSAAAGVLVERSGVVPALGVTALSGLVALLFSLRAVRRLPAGVPV
jgi:predicted MFS family arabinose efflux permease